MALRIRTLIASGGALLLGLALTGCGSTDPGDAPAEHKSFALSGKTLTIDSGHTSLELVPADVRKVEVTRHVDGWVVLGNGPDPKWKMQDDTLTLQVKCRALISDCASQHQVKVPRGVAVVVKGDNGKIVASGFDTPLTLHADNGMVTVRDSSGPLELGSDNGGILTEGISAKSVSARSDNGRIQLGFDSVPDLVDTESDNGGITIDLPGGSVRYAVDAVAHNGRVSVDAPRSDNSGHVVKARSDNGQVTVRSVN
ncbi:DUF4097 family beta strand repeat-containing protein [Streptomyces sp. Ncost-T10-10d]|uniref:DUF4097 family beta strand repeat-containing protein n=1 Tax=Streptomyces sp. Ncost-T10-10d TaxID=1839774 RepID=UPI00081E0A89|nr:DUF4097 family beta strand repeat-containing protein [Streptomyces sp. Ncost-T10-10d]SCF66632.1 Putative adhesin [Streptomyces sp. Ncost-T10-10d]